jgi:hypothetical protein
MFRDQGHPDITLPDWETFRKEFSPYLVEQVLDRGAAGLPSWFLPLARGAAIASPYLLHRAGYRPGSHRARAWFKPNREEVCKDLGRHCLTVLRVRSLWRICWAAGNELSRPHNHALITLVHIFGSTPILTRSYQEATYLCEFCYEDGPPPGLRWVEECPDDMDDAIDFSLDRAVDEAEAARALRQAAGTKLAAASSKYHERFPLARPTWSCGAQ